MIAMYKCLSLGYSLNSRISHKLLLICYRDKNDYNGGNLSNGDEWYQINT